MLTQRTKMAAISNLGSEWTWLVNNELVAKMEAIDRHLTECSKKLCLSSPARDGGDMLPLLLKLQHQGDNVLCTATVEGDRISKADINLRPPGKGGKPLRTGIKEQSPWKLKQVQDAVNQFQRVYDLFSVLRSNKSPSQFSLRGSLDQLSTALHSTLTSLTLPPNTTAKQIFTSSQKNVLKPDLPEDVALYFHISSSLLVMTVLSVTARPSGVKEIKDPLTNSWLEAVFEQGVVSYEVTGQLRVASNVPWLTSVLSLLRAALELTQDLLDKVKVFDGVTD